jgi:betaine lipid synthase
VGCGTARDLEFVLDKIKKRKKMKVYLLDLSPALLEIAKQRVNRLGISRQVKLIQGDITDTKFLKAQDFYGKCDLVTCSYCLTMIPNWNQALVAMNNMLKKDGFLSIVDFTMRYRRETRLDQRFYQWWFSNDGVYFNRDHVNWLRKNMKLVWYYENSSRVPYTVFYPTHYVFVGRKKNFV